MNLQGKAGGTWRVGIILVATGGEKYMRFVKPLIDSLKKFFPPHDVILFTDSEESFDAIKIPQPNLGWPRASLMRYHAMLLQRNLLSQYDQLFYMDADMRVCNPVAGEEIYAHNGGLTAVIHPGYPSAFERRQESTAFVEGNPPYYQGCFIGGDGIAFLKMCEVIAHNVDVDDSNGIVAVWIDESHLNRYLVDHPPVKVLSPAYCWPETYLNHLKILHLEK